MATVVMPSTAHDAKGLLVAAVRDDSPVMYIDDRALYDQEGEVPAELYETPLGQAAVRRSGSDVTIVAWSHAAAMAEEAVATLVQAGYDPELIDLRSLKPWDRRAVLNSVADPITAVVTRCRRITRPIDRRPAHGSSLDRFVLKVALNILGEE